jgi:site-specific recombinase XerD
MLSQIEDFVNWVHRRNAQARTWRDYRNDLSQFAAVVGDCDPAKVTFREIDLFIARQRENGCKPATVNRRLAAIQAFYAFLADEDPDLVCPIIPRRHYLREPQRLPRPVQEEALWAFFTAIEADPAFRTRDRAMFLLMLRCGLRIGEVAGLFLADLYLDEPHPRLLVRGKGSRERTVFLSHQAEHALRLYLTERPSVTECNFVFLSYQLRGLSTTAIHYRLMRYREQAEVHLTAHRLRHSFANDLLSAGAPVTSIQVLLGHRWLETTQIYVTANDQQVAADYFAASKKLEGWSSWLPCN